MLLKTDEGKRANNLETYGHCESVQRWELIQSMMLTNAYVLAKDEIGSSLPW